MKFIKTILLTLLFGSISQNVFAQTQIKMEKKGGVFYIPCMVNGLNLKFIFDTGASNVSISLSEAIFMLKNGYINEDDIIGTEKYQIANGDIAEGTTLIIRELEIGNKKIYNIEASIVHTLSAPLLLGQSAIERFGSFSIDYGSNTLYLEDKKIAKNENLFSEKNNYKPLILNDTISSSIPPILIDTFYSLPNAFTPNHDGINDIFRPLTICSNIISFEIEIMNRWGETVFKTENPEINWTGYNTIISEPLESGIYYYYGTYIIKDINGLLKQKTLPENTENGRFINLIR